MQPLGVADLIKQYCFDALGFEEGIKVISAGYRFVKGNNDS